MSLLHNLLPKMGDIRNVVIDDTRYLFVGKDSLKKVDAKITRALARGATVTENGISQWIENIPILTEDGKPIIHRNEIKCHRIKHTKAADGTVTKETLRTIWADAHKTLNGD